MNNFYDDIGIFGDRTAIITESREKITYSMLVSESDRIVADVESRRIAFIICDNTLEAITGYIACLRKRIVPILINYEVSKDLIVNLYEKYQPYYVYGDTQLLERLFDLSQFIKISQFRKYHFYKTDVKMEYKIHDELALLLTTSGSTGSPKLVRQSYKNIVSNTNAVVQYLNITEDDRAIMTLPMSYTYGLSIINSHLLQGACIIMNDFTLMNREFWQLLKDEEATTFGGVPYIYEILKKLRFERMDLPSLHYITQAGGKLSKELAQEFCAICKQKEIKLIVMYGQTEATARMSYLPWEKAEEKAGSMGIAIPGGAFELRDDNGNVIEAEDMVGELIYKGDNVTLGYAESYFDLNKGDERNGILFTGDMAKVDKDGFFYIVGRKKRFLKIFGNRVNLDEIEGLLKKEGYECICSGKDDEMKLYIVENNSENDIDNRIRNFIIGITHLPRSAFKILKISQIPRNEAGKILYSKLPD